jgi:hypothetical protein
VTLSQDAVPITLTAHLSLTAPAAYILSVRQGQTLDAQVTRTVYLQVLNAQGQALTFPGQAVQFPIRHTGDYIVVVVGEGAVSVIITVSPP